MNRLKKIAFIGSVLLVAFIFLIFYKGNGDVDGVNFEQPSGAEFSETNNFDDEKEIIEDTLSFLDKVVFLDNVKKEEEMGRYYLQKNSIIPTEPSYHLLLDHLIDNESKARMSIDVSTRDAGTKLSAEEVDKVFTTSDGVKVFLEEKNEIMIAYFEKNGLYYTVNGQNRNDSTLTWGKFQKKIEEMSTNNAFSKSVKSELKKESENNLVMPGYFSNNLDLIGVIIEDRGIEFSYHSKHKTSGKKSEVTSKIKYSVFDEPFRYEEDDGKEISLSDGTKADILIGYDYPVESSSSYHQNVIFFENDGYYFQIHSTNIETPINSKDTKQLLKIAESVITR